jgi:hypothetical protein
MEYIERALIKDLIDETQVPRGRHSDPRCHKARHVICDELSTAEKIDAVCFHEIGHLIYLRRASYLTDVEKSAIKIYGPRIIHDEKSGELEGVPALIGSPPPKFYDEHVLSELATVAVAGGEFIRFFFPQLPNLGVAADEQNFTNHHTHARWKLADNNIPTPFVFLAEARASVRQDLQDKAFQDTIRVMAEQVKREVFSRLLPDCAPS